MIVLLYCAKKASVQTQLGSGLIHCSMVGSPQLLWGLYKCKKAVSVCFIRCISDEAKLRNPFQRTVCMLEALLFTELVS